MEVVSFTRMADGTREDYEFLNKKEHEFLDSLPDRILAGLRSLDDSFGGYSISRLEHSLQSATRAHRAGEPAWHEPTPHQGNGGTARGTE